MGNSQNKLEEKIKNLNLLASENKFFVLTGLRLSFEVGQTKIQRDKKDLKIKVSSISGVKQIKTEIGTSNCEKCEKIYNIIQHIMSLDCSLRFNEESTCSICLENFADTILACGHQFCLEDIKSWGNRNQECPLCRQPFTIDENFEKVEGDQNDLKQEIRICKDEMLNLIDF